MPPEVVNTAAQAFAGSPEYWQIEGPFDSSYSLAVVNRELACAMHRLGLDVGLRSMEGAGDYQPSAEFLKENSDCAAMAARYRSASIPDVALRFCYPPRVADMQGRFRVLHSYGWEETGFPPEYVDEFNSHLHLITVLSHSVAKILRDAGVRVPIVVTGAGADHVLIANPSIPAELAGSAAGFRFLHVSSCFPRKGIDSLLWAYGQVFRRSDDVALVIKTFPNPHNDAAQQLTRFRQLDADYPEVLLIEREFSEAEMAGLYRSCQAFVAPSRGEGFGLPLAEAMLCELPVITTAWGGQTDFCDDTTAWMCDYVFAKSQSHFGLTHSVWADADIDDLARLLREVFSLAPESRAKRTAAARKQILEKCTWTRTAQATVQAVHTLSAKGSARRSMRIGWLSTWNKRCGVAAYSGFLTMGIPAERLTVYADRDAVLTAADQSFVRRTWNPGLLDRLDETFAAMIGDGVDAAVIQYNFGFFSLDALARLIERLKQSAIAVHCFFHATGDVLIEGQPVSLEGIAPSLAIADRLYVHSLLDLNRLKKFGLVDNVVLFPQGVLPTPSDAHAPLCGRLGLQGKRIVASYGYLLPHKGMQQLIAAFAELADSDPRLHLLLVNALYPHEASEEARRACTELVERLQLGQRVTLITDYLPDAESLALLQLADLIVFPYQRTQESSSAAVRIGIASGRPVAVTPLSIFDDVAEAVHTLPGLSVEALVGGVGALLGDPQSLAQQLARTSRWLSERQWPHLSQRLLNIIEA